MILYLGEMSAFSDKSPCSWPAYRGLSAPNDYITGPHAPIERDLVSYRVSTHPSTTITGSICLLLARRHFSRDLTIAHHDAQAYTILAGESDRGCSPRDVPDLSRPLRDTIFPTPVRLDSGQRLTKYCPDKSLISAILAFCMRTRCIICGGHGPT